MTKTLRLAVGKVFGKPGWTGPLIICLVLAACTGPRESEGDASGSGAVIRFPEDWAPRVVEGGDDHDHRNPRAHANRSTPNFEEIGWDPLVTDALGTTASGMFCGGTALRPDGRRLAVVNTWFTDVAFILADVTDPAAPRKLGEFVMENAWAYDVDLSPDGMHVLVVTSITDLETLDQTTADVRRPAGVTLWFRSVCGDERALTETPLPLQAGLVLVGISDPMNPQLEDYRALPAAGGHSVSAADVDGAQIVLASVANGAHGASYVEFLEITATPAGARLVPLSVFQAPPGTTGTAPLTNAHIDGTIQKHPINARTYAYLAYWDSGVVIVDVTDPRLPALVSSFSDFGGGIGWIAGSTDGAVHETLPIAGTWNGRHYLFAGQELNTKPADRTSGWVHILDTTDPARPAYIGSWTMPVDVDWESAFPLFAQNNEDYYLFSTHYLAILNQTLFVTQYHGGVWAVDLSDEAKLANPPSVGAFLPTRISPKPGPPASETEPIDYTPAVLDAHAIGTDSLVVFDGTSGLYTVRFDAEMWAPSPPPWRPHDGH